MGRKEQIDKKQIDLKAHFRTCYYFGIFRPRVIERAIKSRERALNRVDHGKGMHPMSRRASFAGLRYRSMNNEPKATYTVIEHRSPTKAAVLMQPESGALTQSTTSSSTQLTFFTPTHTRTLGVSPGSVTVVSPGGHSDKIIQVNAVNAVSETMVPRRATQKLLRFGASPQFDRVTVEVTLTYQQLQSPIKGSSASNRQVNGGESADQKIINVIENAMKKLTEEQQEYKELQALLNNMSHHEYLHHVARHWGRLLEKSGKVRDPSNKENMFVGTAAFNTEMLLFERFADFLIYINHHRYQFSDNTSSVEYTVNLNQNSETYEILCAEVSIKDLRTGMVFTHRWESPDQLQEKPYQEIFEQWLELLKKALGRTLTKGLIPVQNDDNQLYEIPRRFLGSACVAIVSPKDPPKEKSKILN